MNNLTTKIVWDLSDYCKSECSYCPIQLRGGELPHETQDYIRITNQLIDSYRKIGRSIDWVFNGGEPLDMNDIVTLLKLCRENGNNMQLHTNGGRLWMDWWAIEPYVDRLYLTYHYWQNPALIKYIIELFQEKNKFIDVSVPIRHDHFEEDIARAIYIENNHKLAVGKSILYHHADPAGGMHNYTSTQLMIMKGIELVEEKTYYETTTWQDRYKETINSNPSYTGQLCNVGIEYLNITHQGWVKGSNCNNQPLGNIWHDGWTPPINPQVCSMISCVDPSDQKITKFTN
jgi:organic radical activating enzyme